MPLRLGGALQTQHTKIIRTAEFDVLLLEISPA